MPSGKHRMLVIGMVAVATISAAGVSVVNTHQLKKKAAELDDQLEAEETKDAEDEPTKVSPDPDAPGQ